MNAASCNELTLRHRAVHEFREALGAAPAAGAMADRGALAIGPVLAAAQADLAADLGDHREVVHVEPAIGTLASRPWSAA